ncbi:MAG TPA: hypothetical protein PKC22_12090, partial [Rhodocyclaceae bacterium]|nr:hypothetical protein [Rhodocyclaceae bacterium]
LLQLVTRLLLENVGTLLIMNMKVDVGTLWSLWAAADLWASGGKREAFSMACPWGTALARLGGNQRSRLPTNPQRPLFRARRRSLFSLGATKPVFELMARRRDRSFGARTVV